MCFKCSTYDHLTLEVLKVLYKRRHWFDKPGLETDLFTLKYLLPEISSDKAYANSC